MVWFRSSLLLFTACAAVALAQHSASHAAGGGSATQGTHEGTEHHFHRHHAGIFTGFTSNSDEHGYTIGADYEFRFHRRWGVGLDGEWVGGNVREGVWAFPVFFHITRSLKVSGGFGFEHNYRLPEAEHHSSEEGEEHQQDLNTHPLGRVSVHYDIPLGKRFTMTPSFSTDFVQGHAFYVYGVTWGFGF